MKCDWTTLTSLENEAVWSQWFLSNSSIAKRCISPRYSNHSRALWDSCSSAELKTVWDRNETDFANLIGILVVNARMTHSQTQRLGSRDDTALTEH
jgi:hypothetical protein